MTPRRSAPTALIAAPADPDWDYERPILKNHAISGAWGASPDDVWAITDQADSARTAIAHWDGQGWTIGEPVGHVLHLIWGSRNNDIWIGGFAGFLHHFDGTKWTVTRDMPIVAIAGTAPSDVYVLLNDWYTTFEYKDLIRHFDGRAWTVIPSPSPDGHVSQLQAAGPDDLWAIVWDKPIFPAQYSNGAGLHHWNGRSWIEDRHWTAVESGILSIGQGVWLYSPGKGLQHWDGARWVDVVTPSLGTKPQIVGLVGGEAWVLTADGALGRTNGACWQAVRNLGPLEEPYTTLEFTRSLFGGTGWVTIADSYGSVLAADRDGWIDRTAEPPIELTAISGTSDEDLWIVGERGTILHRTATGWSQVPSGTTLTLRSVWALAPNDVWVASDFNAGNRSAVVLHFDGTSFQPPVAQPELHGWAAVQANSSTDVWLFGGDYRVDRWDGLAWSVLSEMRTTSWSTAFWSSGPADAWRAGVRSWYEADHSYLTAPQLDHWDGTTWTPVATARYIGGFWGVSPDSIWAGSDWGLLHWDGKAWNEVSSDTSTSHLGSVWASGDDDVWAIGGNIVGHWDGNVWRTSRVQTPLYYGWTKNLFGTAQGRVWIIGSAGTVARKKP